MDIAAELRARKAFTRTTLADLSRRTGFSGFKINQIMYGRQSPRVSDLHALFAAMGARVDLRIIPTPQAEAA